MGPWSRVRVAKCQMLVTSFFVLLLGLSVATLAALTYFGTHFAVISRVSPEGSPYKAMHHWAFFAGISLAGVLTLGAVLSATATVREAGGLMAGGFLCFALVFCALVQVAFWRLRYPTQVEDAVLDTFDLVYEQSLKSSSSARRQELVAIQDTFLCCGKSSPPSLLGVAEADLCQGQEAGTQWALQVRAQAGGVRWGGGHHAALCSGLPAGHQGLPEDTRTHRLHPDQRWPHLHGVRHAAQLLPLVRHPLGAQLGPERDICPEPPGPWLPAPGAQLLQTLPGEPRPSSPR